MARLRLSERTRLAVEIHDTISQTLTGVACQIAAVRSSVESDPAAAKPKGGLFSTITLVAALVALGIAGVLTFMMYQHWEFLKGA
jgi:signal transduction histidine kinase